MWRRMYGLSFGTRIWIAFVLLISISILATGWASYYFAAKMLQDNTLKMSQDTVNKSAQIMDEKLQKIAVSMMSLMISDSFHDAMNDANLEESGKYYTHLTNLQKVFTQIMFNERIIHSLLISTPMGDYYPTSSVRLPQYSFFDSPIYEQIAKNRKPIWIEGHEDQFFSGNDRVVTLVMEGVIDYQRPLTGVYILVNIKERDLVGLLQKDLSKSASPVFMLNGESSPVLSIPDSQLEVSYEELQHILYTQDPNQEHKNGYFEYDTSSGSTYLVNYYRSSIVKDWVFYRVQSKTELLEQVNVIKWTAITMVSVFILIAFVFSNVLSRLLTLPLKRLVRLMSRVETSDDLSTRYRSSYNDEVSKAGFAFNRMLERIERLIHEMYVTEQSKRKAEMKALTAQIDPHFFYNTLNTIYCKSVLGENEQVNEMIISLSNMFRMGLNNGKNITTLQSELDHVKQYLILQENCYEELFEYEMKIDPEIPEEYPILKLILQPLVENSIFHGFRDRTAGGLIHIAVFRKDDFFCICVTDNGVGFKQKLEGHNSKIALENQMNGYALHNIRERIQLYYGEQAELRIESQVDVGTKITISIPWEGAGVTYGN